MSDEWIPDPDDKVLHEADGPFEVSAVHRLHKHGWPGTEIVRALGVRGTSVVKEIQQAASVERVVEQAGRPIHDALIEIPKEKS